MEIDYTNLTSEQITDFHCLDTFVSGVEAMDNFIQGDFRLSVENHYCTAYGIWYKEELLAIYALSFDSLDLDTDDKDELQAGISSTASPEIDWNYQETFYSKPRLATKEYSAVGFYSRCGFTPNEVKKPYKDTLRMFRTLYAKDEAFTEED